MFEQSVQVGKLICLPFMGFLAVTDVALSGSSSVSIEVMLAIIGVLAVVFLAFTGAVWKLSSILSRLQDSTDAAREELKQGREDRREIFGRLVAVENSVTGIQSKCEAGGCSKND